MKDGKCPKCKSNSVYTKQHGISFKYGGSDFLVMLSKDWAPKSIKEVDHYLCTSCGYMETYVEDKAKLEQVAKDWKKVG